MSFQKWLVGGGKAHINWRVGLKMAWWFKLGRFDWSGVPNGDRVVRSDRQLRAGGRNVSATIGSLGEEGDGKWWMEPIALVLKGRRVSVSEQKNNTNKMYKNQK